MDQLKSCGVIVFRSAPVESFLLMEHADRLDLPKGHIDPGESELECALRELEEETGIQAGDVEIDPAFRFSIQYRVRYRRFGNRIMTKTLVIFLGRLLRSVEVALSEHGGYRWVDWRPPHSIQQQTIDPLLAAIEEYRGGAPRGRT
jgi:8-oxo-dGTP pyrophosphatase MutT (NUDIX family)